MPAGIEAAVSALEVALPSAFACIFSAYFPRSSTQVRPARAPPQVVELIRALEQLPEQESRHRVELLEQKM